MREYRPRDIYPEQTKDKIKFWLKFYRYKVIDFRIPRLHDHYLSGNKYGNAEGELALGFLLVYIACDGWMPKTPRLIVQAKT